VPVAASVGLVGVVVAAVLIDVVVLVTAALVWRYFGHQIRVLLRKTDLKQLLRPLWFLGHLIRVLVRKTDLEQLLRRLWNHRPQLH
jgi:hypothetical protein